MRIKKFVSINLYGETRKEAKNRLLKARVSAAISGKSRNVSYGAGTTQEQKRKRYNTLRKSGLPTKTPKYLEMYS